MAHKINSFCAIAENVSGGYFRREADVLAAKGHTALANRPPVRRKKAWAEADREGVMDAPGLQTLAALC
ncbi:MAG: hypothetical protein EOM66_11445 [Clostridia bacterium]|nr:hypothetical protein [Clostridia bacterium]